MYICIQNLFFLCPRRAKKKIEKKNNIYIYIIPFLFMSRKSPAFAFLMSLYMLACWAPNCARNIHELRDYEVAVALYCNYLQETVLSLILMCNQVSRIH